MEITPSCNYPGCSQEAQHLVGPKRTPLCVDHFWVVYLLWYYIGEGKSFEEATQIISGKTILEVLSN